MRALIKNQSTCRLLSSSFLGLPYRILKMNLKEELLRSLWVDGASVDQSCARPPHEGRALGAESS